MPRPWAASYRWLTILAGILLYLTPALDLRAQSAKRSAAPPATQTIIFMRSEHPVFVELTVLLGSKELREVRSQQVTQAFGDLDANGDGIIDQTERDAAPLALRKLGVQEKWATLLPRLDTNPADQNVSAAELTAFAKQLFGPPVTLEARLRGIRRAGQAVELFDLLDDNQDQVLTTSEFAALSTRLQKLDADGDESFSVVEVEPFRNPFGPRTASAPVPAEDAPWIVAENAAEILLKRFDQQSPMQVLSAAELGISPKLVATGDTDQDGALNLEELRKWLPTVPPHYRLNVSLPVGRTGQTSLVWTDTSLPAAAPANPGRLRPVAALLRKNIETAIAGQPLQIQLPALTSRTTQKDNVDFYKLQFRKSDRDKNKYLDQTEFASLNLPGATFEAVDADGDGQIFDKEIEEFLKLESLVDQVRVVVAYDNNEVSLFSLLDQNKDNRLTPRECLQATTAWKSSDTDLDGQLARNELSGKMRLIVELAKPRLFKIPFTSQGTMTGEPIISPQSETTPVWFRGMDRNIDGDISRREFIGNDDAFRKWDRDGDGLISSAEAGR
ncbi:MAG: hypothetical protein JWN70_6105 [Planctomycetaceae bacterium]|nr:hypothetical protein [Planctomycetaceae bacterium]